MKADIISIKLRPIAITSCVSFELRVSNKKCFDCQGLASHVGNDWNKPNGDC